MQVCPAGAHTVRGLDFDNDSAFMNDPVVSWCRSHDVEVTHSRAYEKNDQAFVEQKKEPSFAALWATGGLKALIPLAH